jgi:hypothetical protein
MNVLLLFTLVGQVTFYELKLFSSVTETCPAIFKANGSRDQTKSFFPQP